MMSSVKLPKAVLHYRMSRLQPLPFPHYDIYRRFPFKVILIYWSFSIKLP